MIPRPCDRSVYEHVHCAYCGKKGHVLCKSQPKLQGSQYGKCGVCGSKDHFYFQCKDRFAPRTIHSGSGEGRGRNGSNGPCFVCGEFVGVWKVYKI